MIHLLLAAVLHYDVLISAGHEGRPASCATFHHKCNLGADGESAYNTVVADAAAAELRSRGFSVAREPADFAGTYDVKTAAFIHFDGSDPACTSGASIGYHTRDSQPLAQRWRTAYSALFPFTFMPDNFTKNLSDYYGFRQVHASDGALVVEFGEISCPRQKAWLAPRLQQLGKFLASFLAQSMSGR